MRCEAKHPTEPRTQCDLKKGHTRVTHKATKREGVMEEVHVWNEPPNRAPAPPESPTEDEGVEV